jgi:predicted alpha-1,6-mannanase (GH76 family)
VRALFVTLLAALQLATGAVPGSDARRAHLAYSRLERVFLDGRTGDYREQIGGRVGSRAWPFSQGLAATIQVAAVPRFRRAAGRAVAARLRELDARFRRGGVYRASPRGSVYYDDNEWVALDLLDWDGVRADPTARREAEQVFAAVIRAWDPDPGKTCPGGVQWTDAPGNDDRNTVSTANGAVLGLRLYGLTHRPEYLRWGRRMLAWVDRCLRGPDGLYWDHVAGDGSIDRTEWSYNQGAVLEAYRLLYGISGDGAYLRRAEAVADRTLAAFAGRWSSGEPPEFAAIFFRRLLSLADVDHRADYVAAARAYADRLWKQPRPRLFDQAALVQLYAALAARAAA